MKSQGRKVFVGLSGGVDSSVSAALLKKQGFDVTGVFIKVWSPASGQGSTRPDLKGPTLNREKGRTLSDLSGRTLFGLCQAVDDRLDAMRVCAKVGIPFVELNLEKEYKREVVDYMIREYRAGRTPNPDVFCNRFIKFGGFYEWARKNGADFVATGHYARVRETRNPKSPPANRRAGEIRNKSKIQSPKLNATCYTLHAGADTNKDQSYFLWQIRREQLPYILFPVGGMKKLEVRRLAEKFGLVTADKKDSQGLCFVGKVDMKEFLSHYIKPKRGEILLAADERGYRRGLTQMRETVIGEHDGAFFYTLGERLGASSRLNLESGKRFNLGESRPLYVIAKDIKKNTLTASHRTPSGDLPRARNEVTITDCNWLAEPRAGKTYGARVRYRQPLQKASSKYQVASSKRRDRILLTTDYILQFSSPQTAAPGQSLVLYDGDVLVGGGIIC